MSAIFGFVHLDDRPVADDAKNRFARRAALWGQDGVSVWQSPTALLGRALMVSTPEDRFDVMPVVDSATGTVVVAAGRLDNRAELCDELRIPSSERIAMSDAGIAARAYLRWGAECPLRLYGDWSMAAWDPRERRLFLARDHVGNTSLFYWCRPPLVAFASDADVLFAHPEIARRLDEEQLARYLTIRPGDADRTFFEGVKLLPPAHHASFDVRGMRASCYWRIEDVPAVRLQKDTDYVEAFLAHYRRAVRERVRSAGPVTSTLSSGLDSGSVTCLAAEALGERGERLTALTAVPAYETDTWARATGGSEGPMAATVAALWPNIDHVLMPSADRSPVKQLESSLDAYCQPIHAASNLFWLLDLFREAQTRQARVLLTGQLGNTGVSWDGGGNRIFFLLVGDPRRKGWPALREWRSRRGVSWARAFRLQVARPIVGSIWRDRRFRQPTVSAHSIAEAAINPHFARQLEARGALALNPALPMGQGFRPVQERRSNFGLNGLAIGPPMMAFGASFGIEVRDPTADLRLLEYCFGIPDEPYIRAGGQRMLIRDAMSGLMPDAMRLDVSRGHQGADITSRLLADRHDMTRVLAQLADSPEARRYLDIRALHDAWRAVPANTSQTVRAARSGLLRGLLAGFFILRTGSAPTAGGISSAR